MIVSENTPIYCSIQLKLVCASLDSNLLFKNIDISLYIYNIYINIYIYIYKYTISFFFLNDFNAVRPRGAAGTGGGPGLG